MVRNRQDNGQLVSRVCLNSMIRVFAKHRNGLNICHINAQSLKNKMDEFRFIFENSGIDVICVSETWFRPDINDDVFSVNGYRLFRSDRIARSNITGLPDRTGRAGGVAIFLKVGISGKVALRSKVEDDMEYIFLDVMCHGSKVFLGCVYRPNKDIDMDNLIKKLQVLSVKYNDIVIAENFNCNLLVEVKLTEPMKSIGIVPVNSTIPTYFTNTSSTLLDVFLVNNRQQILHYDQLSAPMFSKHDLIFLKYNVHPNISNHTFTYRDFKNINTESLLFDLQTVVWEQIYNFSNVDEQLQFLEGNILNLYNKHVPVKTKVIHQKDNPWFSNETKRLIKERDYAYDRWKKNKTDELHEIYRRRRRAVVSKIRQDKSSYYEDKFNSAIGGNKTWKEIKKIGLIKQQEKKCDDLNTEVLNNKFVNIEMPDVDASFYNNQLIAQIDGHQFHFQFFSQFDVIQSFWEIKSNSVGCDDIHPRFIKLLLPHIITYITYIFNNILATSTFPSTWKYAKIIPVPKAGNDYRPIAILPYLSKIFEKLIHKQMLQYVLDKGLLTSRQSGFRPKHSCITALVDVVEGIRSKIDDDQVSFLVLLDHSKVFDTVHHATLCNKLRLFFNFSQTSSKLISTYLSGRHQAVFDGTRHSSWLPVTRGVPQGSILGPLLYSMYSNDLPMQLRFMHIQMYADDVQLFIGCKLSKIDECISNVNSDLLNVYEWATANGLRLNSSKSKCIQISRIAIGSPAHLNVFLGSSKIDMVPTAKNLGLTFTTNLSWSEQIKIAAGKTYGMLRNLWTHQYFTPIKIRMLLAKTYLVPTLLYGCELFAGCNTTDKRKLRTTYNNIARYVFGLKRSNRISNFSKKIFGVSFDNLLKCRSLLFLQKIVYTKQPHYLFEKLSFARSNRGKIITPIRHRFQSSDYQFFIYAIHLWNELPHNIQNLSNAAQFKKSIFAHFENK